MSAGATARQRVTVVALKVLCFWNYLRSDRLGHEHVFEYVERSRKMALAFGRTSVEHLRTQVPMRWCIARSSANAIVHARMHY